MNHHDSAYERRARVDINKLKEKYVIDIVTAERLEEILVYLYLSQNSKNQRGVQIQTDKLKNVLQNCRRIVPRAMQAHSAQATARL